MGRNAIQFQKGLSFPEFQQRYGTEAQCEEALAQIRWPDGFRCPRCDGAVHGLVYGRRLKRYPPLSGKKSARSDPSTRGPYRRP